MSVINCDTAELKKISDEFNSLTQEYYQEVVDLFETISSLNTAWSGSDSDLYISTRLKEKEDFEKLGQELSDFSQRLENCQSIFEDHINYIRR